METELKLSIAPGDVAALRRLALLKDLAVRPPVTRLLRTTYFDTPKLKLAAQGLELRVRRSGRSSVQTLKTVAAPGASLHQRHEWASRVAGTQPRLDVLFDMVGADTVPGHVITERGLARKLTPVFESDVRRTTWTLRLPRGTEVELALDQGWLRHGEARAQLCEIELELLGGELSGLFELALQLQDHVHLRINRLGKAARGYALLASGARPPAGAAKARPLRLEAGMTIEQGFQAIATNCLAQLLDNEAAVAERADPEGIHQMRVGLRRLRTALGLFRPWVALPQNAREELEWLGTVLGRSRDADVLAQSTLRTVVEICPGELALQPLLRSSMARAARLRREAAAAVASPRQARLALQLCAWIHTFGWRDGLDAASSLAIGQPLVPHARQVVRRSRHKLHEAARRLPADPSDELHRVRIAAKRARYATEFFRTLLPARETTQRIARMTDLQERLGSINDKTVAGRLLSAMADERPSLAAACEFARGHLHAEAMREARKLRRDLGPSRGCPW
jgi:inorganic triphosphatase YgiF